MQTFIEEMLKNANKYLLQVRLKRWGKKRSLDSVNYPSFYLPAFTFVFANSLT
jgi:hypothetical protein